MQGLYGYEKWNGMGMGNAIICCEGEIEDEDEGNARSTPIIQRVPRYIITRVRPRRPVPIRIRNDVATFQKSALPRNPNTKTRIQTYSLIYCSVG